MLHLHWHQFVAVLVPVVEILLASAADSSSAVSRLLVGSGPDRRGPRRDKTRALVPEVGSTAGQSPWRVCSK